MEKNYITYYQLLEIEPYATTEDILKAYKKKAIEYHPDKNDGHKTANKLFQMIQEAKEVLTDLQKRLEYDYTIGAKKRPESISEKNNFIPMVLVAVLFMIIGVIVGSSGKGGNKI